MANQKFQGEFDTRASRKIIYPYISTPGGLAQWFADDVTIDEDKVLHFTWDGEDHPAKLAAQKANSHVRFEFLNDPNPDDNSFVEIRLEESELTESVFIKVTDYSDWDDEQEQQEIWEGLIQDLNEIVGG